MCQELSFGLIMNLSRFRHVHSVFFSFKINKLCKRLTCLELVLGIPVLHEEVHDLHCGHDEEREAFCITGRSYYLGTGKFLLLCNLCSCPTCQTKIFHKHHVCYYLRIQRNLHQIVIISVGCPGNLVCCHNHRYRILCSLFLLIVFVNPSLVL